MDDHAELLRVVKRHNEAISKLGEFMEAMADTLVASAKADAEHLRMTGRILDELQNLFHRLADLADVANREDNARMEKLQAQFEAMQQMFGMRLAKRAEGISRAQLRVIEGGAGGDDGPSSHG